MAERRRTKEQTMIYTTLHRKLQINDQEPHGKLVVNAGDAEAVSAPLVHGRRVTVKRHEGHFYGSRCEHQYQ